jgi:hypothetical protein
MPLPLHSSNPLLAHNQLLTYDRLQQCYRKSIRTKTWRRLHYRDKALFRASMDYLQRGGRIMNESLLAKLERLVEQLTETQGQRIVSRGLAKATAMLNGIENGMTGWVLRLQARLKDPAYIFWLGMAGVKLSGKFF